METLLLHEAIVANFHQIFILILSRNKHLCKCGHNAYCLRLNPGARWEHLAIQLSWMAPWLLVKCVCPVHFVERWGCSPGLWLWQSIRCLILFLNRAGSIVDISPSSHHWSPGSIPQRRQKIILRKWWGRLWDSV